MEKRKSENNLSGSLSTIDVRNQDQIVGNNQDNALLHQGDENSGQKMSGNGEILEKLICSITFNYVYSVL